MIISDGNEWDAIATGFGEYAQQLCNSYPGAWSTEGYASDFSDGSGYRAAYRWLDQYRLRVIQEVLDYTATDEHPGLSRDMASGYEMARELIEGMLEA